MKKFGFKTRILIPAAALLCVLLAGFLYGIWSFLDYRLRQDFSSRLESSQLVLQEYSGADIKVLSAAMEVLCRDAKLQTLWRQRDRAALEEYTQPLFKNLHEKYNITHFYFHEPNRICFLRVHQPDRHGDLIERETLLQSQKSGCVGAGIELGPLGTLTLRVVQPWVIDGRVEGYLELGEEITQITGKIAKILNVDVAVLIDKSYLDREGWTSGMAMHDRATNWDDLPHEVAVDCQPAGITPVMLSGITTLQDNSTDQAVELEVQGIPYMAGATRLLDFRRRDVGRMVVFEDVSRQRAALEDLLLKLGGFFFFIAAACLLGAYAYLTHIEKLLHKSQQQVIHAVEEREGSQTQHLEEMLQFRKAFECATDAIAIAGLDRQLLFINPAFEHLLGYTLEEANAQGGTKHLYYDQQLGIKAFLMVSQGRSFSGEMGMLTRDNRVVQVFLRVSPILNKEGKMFGILGIYTDLSERKSVERELLRQSEALLESNRALMAAKQARELSHCENQP